MNENVACFWKLMKKSWFSTGPFSSLSTNFSILSSLSGRIRPHLAPETQNSRSIDAKLMKNRHSKCEKCNFDPIFQPRKIIQKKKFFEVSARSQRVLTLCEENFQNFGDTDENELMQISSKFIKIPFFFFFSKFIKIE